MRIRKIRLKNGYKRFRDLTIDLGDIPARIIALVGPNGCGKSSVLDGLLYVANNYGGLGVGGQHGDTYHSMDGLSKYDAGNIEIDFTNGEYRQIFHARRATEKWRTIFSFRSPYRYNSNLKIRETRATTDIRLNN
ncbi:AAA family ATPase [Ferrovibrio sp.]|uniref:AAA family ATPase n=1 Tax=Ferrovibrio sp. TaxID=1917215 RepID=UPI0035B0E558